MLYIGSFLQYKYDCAECVARLEIGMTHDNFTKFEKLGVNALYRKKGLATYLINRTTSWGTEKGISGLYLKAATSPIKLVFSNVMIMTQIIWLITIKEKEIFK